MVGRRFRECVILVGLAALWVACVPATTREQVKTEARATLPPLEDAWAAAQASVGDVQLGWLGILGDPALAALVDEAQANNRDLQAAAAGVERSWALARQAGVALKPSVDLALGGTRSGTAASSPNPGSASVGVQASWEVDLWGRMRAGKQAALADAEAIEADFRYAQHSLAAAVARAYFLAVDAGLQVALEQESLEAVTETHRIVMAQFDSGSATPQDRALATSDLETSKAGVAAAGGAQREALRALEVLLGRYPGGDVGIRDALPPVPPAPPAGVPSELLERRPDLVAAERQVAAAFSRTDQAKAARLPRLSLTGSASGASSDLSDLLNPANVAWNAGANLLAPIFDAGSRKIQVEISSAEQEQALAAYAQSALNAFKDVESGLDQLSVLETRHRSLELAAVEAREALRVAQLRHQEGETDLLDVLSIRQRVLNADRSLLTIDRARLDQWVNLNLALGGGWD